MSSGRRGVLGVVGSAAGGVEALRTGLVEPAMARGWQVAVTLTPTAGQWLRMSGEVDRLEKLTGLPVRDEPRLPGEARSHPAVDCYAVAPASANMVAKLAVGLMDNQALTQVGEAIGTLGLPVVVFPRVNAAHARHPAWQGHVDVLVAGEFVSSMAPMSGRCTSQGKRRPDATCRGRPCWTPWMRPLYDASSTFLTCMKKRTRTLCPGPRLLRATCSLACQGSMIGSAS